MSNLQNDLRTRKPGRKAGAAERFIDALDRRMEEVAALRRFGLAWQGVAQSFSTDPILGSVTPRTFRETFIRLGKRGRVLDEGRLKRFHDLLIARFVDPISVLLNEHSVVQPVAVVPPPAQVSPVVARHQAASATAGVPSSFPVPARDGRSAASSPLPSAQASDAGMIIGADGKAVDLARRAGVDAQLRQGRRLSEETLCGSAGLHYWVARRLAAAPQALEVALPKFLWSLEAPPDAMEYLRSQPECEAFLALKDSGVGSYAEAVRVLEESGPKRWA